MFELILMTLRATNSFSSKWLSLSLVGSGITKYRQINGSPVIFLVLRTGIFERLMISKCRSKKLSHSFFADKSS